MLKMIFTSGYRWVDYHNFPAEKEKDYIRKAITSLKALTGYTPRGWYYGRDSPRSRALVPEVYKEMGEELLWYSDTYADYVPYWVDLPSERNVSNPKGLLMVPHSFDCIDFKFYTAPASFGDPQGFFVHLKNALTFCTRRGMKGCPR